MKFTAIVVSIGSLFLVNQASAAELFIKVSGITATEGSIRIALFNSEATFNDTPYAALSMPVTDAQMQVQMSDLPAGEYALMLFQDIDNNEELNTNLFGMPREPWGASLQGKTIMRAPVWSDLKFMIDNDTAIIVELN